jgi:hypothetical protein
VTRALVRPWSAWQRFWFEPEETSSLALFRIAFGLVAIAWTVTLIPNLFVFFGPDGILPRTPASTLGHWGILALSNNRTFLLVVFVATLAAAVALTFGFLTRGAALVLWVGILSFEQRNWLVTNSGDGLLCGLAFFCALAPTGAALSIDRILKAPGRFWEFPARAPWALRLIQIQISVGYLSAVWQKSRDNLWIHGTAASYVLRIQDLHRMGTLAFVTHSAMLTKVLTFGVLALEFSLGVLVWNRRARPWVLAMGICLHLSIDSSIIIGFFSYAMLAAYLSFVRPEKSAQWILGARDVFIRLVSRRPDGSRVPPSVLLPAGPIQADQARSAAIRQATRSPSRSPALDADVNDSSSEAAK